MNGSAYFHVTEGLVPDIMHDVIEGSLAFETKELLKHLIAEHVINIDALNEAIRLFPYSGSDAVNKPSPNMSTKSLSSADHSLRLNGIYIHILNLYTIYSYDNNMHVKCTIVIHYSCSIHVASQTWCLSRLLPLMIGDKFTRMILIGRIFACTLN